MSAFYNNLPTKGNNLSHHPWEGRIKDQYVNQMKHAHNSINNPKYPKKKSKTPDNDRSKFTIIGNRITKEFIYCMHLIKGLHKYRWKHFEAPIIRGVTTIEWPNVLRDLKIQYGGLAYCLQSQVAVLLNDKFLGGEKELEELIKTKYVYHICLDYYKESVAQFASFISSSGRPCVYMHFSINDEHVGTMIFMLYSDIVPFTCENFLRLCKTRRGGYSGTPVHRIVRDSWIQCGGYGLKDTDLDCENFIVPHDRRGVLCMANAYRHVDCSTQFFVLLQPAPWMAHKYVAFGQLIEGEETLKKIENVPTWYESPTSEIIIHQAGIFNMECHDIMINKGTNEYIDGHIEDLITIGELFYEALMERVFLEIEFRRIKQLDMLGEPEGINEETSNIRATQRFLRKKEDIEKQLEFSNIENRHTVSVIEPENNEFDVEVYEYEPEEYSYQHVSTKTEESLIVKATKPYYLPLTDVLYPGEVDSTYDLKKFLRGDYCLESDLQKDAPKKTVPRARPPVPSKHINLVKEESESGSEESLDSDDQKEIRRYLKLNVDRVSFAGSVIKNIAGGHGKFNIFEESRISQLIANEESRRFRLASLAHKTQESHNKNVSIKESTSVRDGHTKIKRRQTGFVRPEDVENDHIQKSRSRMMTGDEYDSNINTSRKVRIASTALSTSTGIRPAVRRATGFVRPSDIDDSDTEVQRQSVLTRLYDDLSGNEDIPGPTLKDYKPMSETQQKNLLFLIASPNLRIKSDENTRESYMRRSTMAENGSFEQLMNLQHGKKVVRKISSDYVKTIDQMEHKVENSLRSVEFAKVRPAISILEYQQKNQRYQDDLRNAAISQLETVMKASANFDKPPSVDGLRLPGDTPLYSFSDSDV